MFQSFVDNQHQKMNFSYLFSTKDREVLENYFKLKNKYDYSFEKNEYEKLKEQIILNFGSYDVVVYPETSGIYLSDIAQSLGQTVFCIKKNSKELITKELLNQKLMKAEKESLLKVINDMGDTFKINQIKGNQRKRFKDILFQKIDLSNFENKKILLLDDSVFSGNTLLALKESLNIECDVKVIFSKY